MFTLHAHGLTSALRGGGGDGGFTGQKAAKPVTTVQGGVPTFLSVKLLDMENTSCVCGDKTSCF